MKKDSKNTDKTKAINYEPLLCAGLRVKLTLTGVNGNSFFIQPMPIIPRKGELLDVVNMFDEKNYTELEIQEIYDYIWRVWYVNWDKDKEGYFAEIVCEGS